MKKSTAKEDKSAVYRTTGFGKIKAPTPLPKDEPKVGKIVGRNDLRGGTK